MSLERCGLVVAVALGLLVSPAVAAPVPRAVKADEVTDDLLTLLENRRVQRELKMTAEQRATLHDGLDALIDQMSAEFQNAELRIPGGPAAPRPARNYDEVRKEYQVRKREHAAGVITRPQLKRLQEVEVRLLGEFAPMNPRVSENMKLTEKQKKRVAEVLRENEDFGHYAQQQVPVPNDAPRKVYKRPKEMREAVEAELTATQRKVWVELAGEKLAFDPDTTQSDFNLRGKYRMQLRPDGYVGPKKGGVGR